MSKDTLIGYMSAEKLIEWKFVDLLLSLHEKKQLWVQQISKAQLIVSGISSEACKLLSSALVRFWLKFEKLKELTLISCEKSPH